MKSVFVTPGLAAVVVAGLAALAAGGGATAHAASGPADDLVEHQAAVVFEAQAQGSTEAQQLALTRLQHEGMPVAAGVLLRPDLAHDVASEQRFMLHEVGYRRLGIRASAKVTRHEQRGRLEVFAVDEDLEVDYFMAATKERHTEGTRVAHELVYAPLPSGGYQLVEDRMLEIPALVDERIASKYVSPSLLDPTRGHGHDGSEPTPGSVSGGTPVSAPTIPTIT